MNDFWIAVTVAAIAAIPGMLALYAQRQSVAATAADTITDAAIALVNENKVRVAMFQAEAERNLATIGVLREQAESLHKDIELLKAEIIGLRSELAEFRATTNKG